MTQRTHYEVLMLHRRADSDIVATVYRRLAKRYHPDRDPSPEARRRMVELNEAYEVLRDPVRRARYDAELARLEAEAASARRAASSPAGGTHGGPVHADSLRARPAPAATAEAATDPGSAYGEAGSPPAGASTGSVITFGRYRGWTVGQVARVDRDFLEWLRRTPAGRAYRAELAAILDQRRA